jgi:hypothetical protein
MDVRKKHARSSVLVTSAAACNVKYILLDIFLVARQGEDYLASETRCYQRNSADVGKAAQDPGKPPSGGYRNLARFGQEIR